MCNHMTEQTYQNKCITTDVLQAYKVTVVTSTKRYLHLHCLVLISTSYSRLFILKLLSTDTVDHVMEKQDDRYRHCDPLVRTSPRFNKNSDVSVTIQPRSSVNVFKL